MERYQRFFSHLLAGILQGETEGKREMDQELIKYLKRGESILKRNMKVLFICILCITTFFFTVYLDRLTAEVDSMSPEEVLKVLKEGNLRFLEGQRSDQNIGEDRREELAIVGQHPMVVIIS